MNRINKKRLILIGPKKREAYKPLTIYFVGDFCFVARFLLGFWRDFKIIEAELSNVQWQITAIFSKWRKTNTFNELIVKNGTSNIKVHGT